MKFFKKTTGVILSFAMLLGTMFSVSAADTANINYGTDFTLTDTEFSYSRDFTNNKETYSITVQVTNNLNISANVSADCTIFAAVYSESGALKTLDRQKLVLPRNSTSNVPFILTSDIIDGENSSTIKIFLWDEKNIKPLCHNITRSVVRLYGTNETEMVIDNPNNL